MLGQRLRRWPNIKSTLAQRFVLDGLVVGRTGLSTRHKVILKVTLYVTPSTMVIT